MKGKRILCFLCVCFMAIALTGCVTDEPVIKETDLDMGALEPETTESHQTALDPPEMQPSQEKPNNSYDIFESFKIVCEESPNYKLLTNEDGTGYCYYVYDNAGELLDSGYHDYRACGFAFKDGYLSYYSAGLTFAWYERYYDTENGRVSRYYYRPLDTYENLVAYYGYNNDGDIILIVSDMFDKQTYYCEFGREFSLSVMMGGSTGSFSDDGENLTVTYIVTDHENKTDTEITEIFQLP